MKTTNISTGKILLLSVLTTAAMAESTPKESHIANKAVELLLKKSAKQYLNYQQNTKAGSEFISMGNDPNCTYDIMVTSIQQAIDNGASEIRLATNATYNENIFISNKNLSIRGGFLNCADANTNTQQTTKTLLSGTGESPVISISGSNANYDINIQNLDIRNGQGGDFFPGGGISTLAADANITLENVMLTNNTGDSGGGIAINGGSTALTLIDTVLLFNQAPRGGGLYCTGDDGYVSIFGNSGIVENTATGTTGVNGGGGGIYLTDGCIASVFSGSATQYNQYGISGNVSELDGGGVYLDAGAKLNLYGQAFCFFNSCFGNSFHPVNITNNSAKDHHVYDFYGNGGGIYASDNESKVYMQGVLINNNQAEQKGAGIYMLSGNLEVSKQAGNCWDNNRCNFFQGNVASNQEGDKSYGGAIYKHVGQTNIQNSYFENNRADFGTVLAMHSGLADLSGVVMNHNGSSGQAGTDDQYVIAMDAGATLTLEHVTIADNNSTSAVIGRPTISATTVNMYSSIIYDTYTGPVFSDFSYLTADIECVIAHEVASLQTLGGSHVLNNNPRFKDPMARDYHLDAMLSPAVDLCAQSDVLGNLKDMDGQARGWDDGTIPNDQNNVNYVYDAGADETYDNDIIFINGFK
jgi:hypothetical protein